jgi:hypothetical protein
MGEFGGVARRHASSASGDVLEAGGITGGEAVGDGGSLGRECLSERASIVDAFR